MKTGVPGWAWVVWGSSLVLGIGGTYVALSGKKAELAPADRTSSKTVDTKTQPFARYLIGDSLAEGLEDPLWDLGMLTGSRTERGTTIPQWLRMKLPRGRYLVSLGTNDMAGTGVKPELVAQLARQLGDSVWLLPPPMPTLPKYTPGVQVLRKTAGSTIEPAVNLPRTADRIHLTQAGYKQWAEHIAQTMRRMAEAVA